MSFKNKFFLFLLLFGIWCYSQEQVTTSELGNIDKDKQFITLALQNWEFGKEKMTRASTSSHVFIVQVGSGNNVKSNISSPDAIVNMKQEGGGNNIDLQLETEKVRYNVFQTGNNNYLHDHTYAPLEPIIELNLEQNGNENQFYKYGTNSITNKLKFNLTGDSKAFIIKSYQ
ncbi:hypothetical protein [Autumnicola edwardsiae]|jgi:hypothetical protein|uniref:Uncharacterized protein n=1 Tax=Autumnicola edwardsiae TaxID=3075594 RepID=A0ABU3CY30_9FLAO|nr:hypothetical protein [Zunongwangia sp. F297]MDT0651262.1 hypothetical protein [Zunongwangia sp. F297]